MEEPLLGEGDTETSVGIRRYANKELGFRGILKQRYSDFVVREVNREGSIAALSEISPTVIEEKYFRTSSSATPPAATPDSFADLAQSTTDKLRAAVHGESSESPPGELEEQLRGFIVKALEKLDDCPESIVSYSCSVKDTRTKLHQIVRQYLVAAIDSDTVDVEGNKHLRLLAKHKIKKGAGANGGNGQKYDNRRAQNQWPSGLDNYLRFTLLKENVDTMTAVGVLAKNLRIKTTSIQYAGTKDKRAVTAQTCTVYRGRPTDVAKINRYNAPPMIRVGDFEYVKDPAQLGDLAGNSFGIILRAIDVEPPVIARACEAMQRSGFINYYGLQRFGKGGSKSHDIGRALFRGEWKQAVDMLFTERESDIPVIVEAKAAYFAGDIHKALKLIPQQLHSERCVLEGLKSKANDYCGAFNRIAKNPRLICVHAYQSYIWNMAASTRINMFDLEVVEGDLVAIGAAALATDELDEAAAESEDTDALVSSADAAVTTGDTDNIQRVGKHSKADIHIVTAEDIAAKKYTIHDVILPLPGSDVVLPTHEVGKYYLSLLSKDGLSLETFSKCYSQFRMSGAYRRLLQLPKDFQWTMFEYDDPKAELVPTEWSYLRQNRGSSGSNDFKIPLSHSIDAKPYGKSPSPSAAVATDSTAATAAEDTKAELESAVEPVAESGTGKERLIGLELRFTLPPGTYATMMLREVTKQGTDTEFQASLTASTAGGPGIKSSRAPAAVVTGEEPIGGADNAAAPVSSLDDDEDASPAKKMRT